MAVRGVFEDYFSGLAVTNFDSVDETLVQGSWKRLVFGSPPPVDGAIDKHAYCEACDLDYSFIDTADGPAFVDVRGDDFCIDPDVVEAAVTPRTRAIMPVSLYGQPADMPALAEIADRRRLTLIEDAAQAHGAAIGERRSGSWGVGCFSFYPTKNMTTGEGGMLTTADAELAERARLLREHGHRVRQHLA
mgnify:CR=1 FL=1